MCSLHPPRISQVNSFPFIRICPGFRSQSAAVSDEATIQAPTCSTFPPSHCCFHFLAYSPRRICNSYPDFSAALLLKLLETLCGAGCAQGDLLSERSERDLSSPLCQVSSFLAQNCCYLEYVAQGHSSVVTRKSHRCPARLFILKLQKPEKAQSLYAHPFPRNVCVKEWVGHALLLNQTFQHRHT